MKIGLLVLIGLPGSGKTTLAQNLTNHAYKCHENEYKFNFIHVCYDDLISFPSGRNEFEWKSARNSVLVKIDNLIKAIKYNNFDVCPPEFNCALKSANFSEGDFVLIIDDNMYFRSMRYSVFQIAKKQRISFCQIHLNLPVENAILNNSLRQPETAVPVEVITNMNSKFEPPNCKNNWEKYSIELTECFTLFDIENKVLPLLRTSLNNVFYEINDSEDKELSKIQCKKSVLHQSDIALRRIISCKVKNYLKENSGEKSKEFITELNLRKSELLLDIKTGNICLPDEILEEINSDDVEKIQLINFLGSYFEPNMLLGCGKSINDSSE